MVGEGNCLVSNVGRVKRLCLPVCLRNCSSFFVRLLLPLPPGTQGPVMIVASAFRGISLPLWLVSLGEGERRRFLLRPWRLQKKLRKGGNEGPPPSFSGHQKKNKKALVSVLSAVARLREKGGRDVPPEDPLFLLGRRPRVAVRQGVSLFLPRFGKEAERPWGVGA